MESQQEIKNRVKRLYPTKRITSFDEDYFIESGVVTGVIERPVVYNLIDNAAELDITKTCDEPWDETKTDLKKVIKNTHTATVYVDFTVSGEQIIRVINTDGEDELVLYQVNLGLQSVAVKPPVN